MFQKALDAIFSTPGKRFLSKHQQTIERIRELESKFEQFSNEDFKIQTEYWRNEIRTKSLTLEDILPEAFAAVREATKRTLGMKQYDVQFLGGIALHYGHLAEMATGEGKTLVSVAPAYLNALTGDPVMVIPPNDYLAQRDADIVRPIYTLLGMTVSSVTEHTPHFERKKSYGADITYVSNNQVAFDYLKDNMCFSYDQKMQRGLSVAFIDEVDNILIDESRVPLIISGPAEESSELYKLINPVMLELKEDVDYKLEIKNKEVLLTNAGSEKIEEYLREKLGLVGSLYSEENVKIYHYVMNSLKAHKSRTINVDYVVMKDEVMIIDEFTGRIYQKRRYANGLHQAIEAKEGVPIREENITLASTTYTNFFKLFKKLGGMSGTLMTDSEEFEENYNLQIIPIPRNRKLQRVDNPITLYNYKSDLYHDLIQLITIRHSIRQPILICTQSVAESEIIADLLRSHNFTFNLLNAKNHEREAFIVAQAGCSSAITIATNMAGRGTDILLGGNAEMEISEMKKSNPYLNEEETLVVLKERIAKDKKIVHESGGLLVIIIETPDAQKIEEQFQGRSGRQGDVGETFRFFSLEDELLRPLFSDPLNRLSLSINFPEELKKHQKKQVNEIIRQIQGVHASHHFESRKNLIKFEEEISKQRKALYDYRDYIMLSENQGEDIFAILTTYINHILSDNKRNSVDKINSLCQLANIDVIEDESLNSCIDRVKNIMIEKINNSTTSTVHKLLSMLDKLWAEHLAESEGLQSKIHFMAYGKNPYQEYRVIVYKDFLKMLTKFQYEFLSSVFRQEDTMDAFENEEEMDQQSSFNMEQLNDSLSRLQNMFNAGEINNENLMENLSRFINPDLMKELMEKVNIDEIETETSQENQVLEEVTPTLDNTQYNYDENNNNNNTEEDISFAPKKKRGRKKENDDNNEG